MQPKAMDALQSSQSPLALNEAIPQIVNLDREELQIEKITLTSANLSHTETKPTSPIASVPQSGCAMTLAAEARPNAMAVVTASAPCRSGERITFHHHGMMFTETLNDHGHVTVTVPALSETAVILVDPADGKGGAVARIDIPDFKMVQRVVLQWQGRNGFELHAREFGANYGEAGHVWRGATYGVGSIIALGDETQRAPRLAEVYSLRTEGGNVLDGEIDLTVETEITMDNCGQDLMAQTLELQSGRLRTRDLILNMPNCSAVGDFLVLNNLVENLKIAQN